MRRVLAWVGVFTVLATADDNRPLGERTRQYVTDLVKFDTANPPGNETRVADYLKQVAESHGISYELIGADPRRMNFVARLRGSGKGRPLLLMAHSDVLPADRNEWSADPFAAETRGGFLFGRGTQNDKSLLAAELAVMVEIKRRNIKLSRDVILLSEADAESGSTGIEWITKNAWPKIDAEFALHQGGHIIETKDGPKVFQVQTMEKIPMTILLTGKVATSPASLARSDNPAVHVSRAVVKLSEAEQPVRMNLTTRRYLRELSRLPEYSWLEPIRRKLDDAATAQATAKQIGLRDLELDAMLRTTVVPTVLGPTPRGVIANPAAAQVEVRRIPSETREEVLARLRQIISDSEVEVTVAPGRQIPSAEPSSVTTPLYRAMERAIARVYPRDVVAPYMSRGATDASFLRAKGMAVYGVPIFLRDGSETRARATDERIAIKSLEDGVELLWQIVLETAGEN